MTKCKSVKGIFQVTLLVFAIFFVTSLIENDLKFDGKELPTQFVLGTAFGFLVLMFVIVVGMCVSEELPRKTELVLYYSAAILHLLSVPSFILSLYASINIPMLITVTFCIFLTCLYLALALLISCGKDLNKVPH